VFCNTATTSPKFQRPSVSISKGLMCQVMCWHSNFVHNAVVCPTQSGPRQTTAFCINTACCADTNTHRINPWRLRQRQSLKRRTPSPHCHGWSPEKTSS
jgi:hypothetical protein